MQENQNYSQQPSYQAPPPPPQYQRQDMAPVMTMGQWIVTMLLMCIPFVNFILLIVWAVSSTENPNRSNWAKAQLIFMIIGIVLYIVIFAGMISAAGGFMEALN